MLIRAPYVIKFQGAELMFNAIIVGVLCALMGIGAGYLILNAFFAGVRHIAKPRIVNIKKAAQEMLDN